VNASPEKAFPCFERAANILRPYRERYPIMLASALDGVGCTHPSEGPAALQSLHIALALRIQNLGPRHVDTVDTMHHLGLVFLKGKNARGSRRCFSQAAILRAQIFGPAHPSVAGSVYLLAKSFILKGDRRQAEYYLDLSEKIYVQDLGLKKDSPSVVRVKKERSKLRSRIRALSLPPEKRKTNPMPLPPIAESRKDRSKSHHPPSRKSMSVPPTKAPRKVPPQQAQAPPPKSLPSLPRKSSSSPPVLSSNPRDTVPLYSRKLEQNPFESESSLSSSMPSIAAPQGAPSMGIQRPKNYQKYMEPAGAALPRKTCSMWFPRRRGKV